MNYTLLIAGREIPIQAEVHDGTVTASISGRDVTARYRIISDNQISIEHDGRTESVFLCPDHEGRLIHVDGIAYPVRDAAAVAESARKRKGPKELPQEVTPPMPSVVVRVMVSEGDIVERGQGIVVVSAMKMETTLQAPFAGRVTRINAAEGEKVMPGMILVDIERQEEGHG